MEIDRMIDDGYPNTEPLPSNRDRMRRMLEILKETPGEEAIDAGVYRFAWVPFAFPEHPGRAMT